MISYVRCFGPREALAWLAAEHLISSYIKPTRFRSDFCSRCASPVSNPVGATRDPDRMIIHVKVKPNARESRLVCADNGLWSAQVKSPPVDGKANAELLKLIAKHFRCHKTAVSIKGGGTGRVKIVQIDET